MREKISIGRLSKLAKATLLRMARVFGVISPTINKIGTIINRL